ncbi:MAG: export transporter permease LptF [Pseudomonadota bacterium]
MLFQSSIRQELARSFGATLVVLFIIVLTMLLIRTLGLASRGSVNPEEVMLVLGYTVLGRMPTILTLALFIAIVSTLSRMYSDSEMIVWFASGRSLAGFLEPVLRFAWPVLLSIFVLVLLVWPWSNQQTDELRARFQQRSDLERVAPGQFQESSDGRRVFFIDKDTGGDMQARHIFIASQETDGRQIITSARSGRLEWVNDQQLLLLNNGQRLEIAPDQRRIRVSEFEEYSTVVNSKASIAGSNRGLKALPTWELMRQPTPAHQGELGWRLGMGLTAFNFVLIAVAATAGNPRAGRGGNLSFTLFAFLVYYNLLNLGENWVSKGVIGIWGFTLALHGSALLLTLLWLAKRHYNVSAADLWRTLRRPSLPSTPEARP